jgi:hypothetical protein
MDKDFVQYLHLSLLKMVVEHDERPILRFLPNGAHIYTVDICVIIEGVVKAGIYAILTVQKFPNAQQPV